ncbi:unnamed protein product [Bemisia tabaci]|uniref:RNA-directed RNA polymerase C-terminal domain-containing protein n=1 Tax=Bemisia tabaci TaxID=7038 RepID=A0A9P0A4B5_BEMTA|nr:unnamed protein product [Bemisia tabaci]
MRLAEYNSGMYREELHYKSLYNYDRPLEEDDIFSRNLLNHPSFKRALNRCVEEFSHIRVSPIQSDHLDDVKWQGCSAAGYGYIGKKRDNYLAARRNASRALYDFDKYREKYRFVPDKAYARCQLTERLNPKVWHIWGRPFHSILIEGCIASPIIDALLLEESPIFLGRDLHKDMPYSIIKMLEQANYAYCLDFSKFDAHLSRGLIDAAWQIVKTICPPKTESDFLCYEYAEYFFIKCNTFLAILVEPFLDLNPK